MFSEQRFRERFHQKIEKQESCWMWISCLNNWGYGTVSRRGRTVLAHRVSYEISVGPIPQGLLVLHRCDVPACIRPDHLFLGSAADNSADARKKGRLLLISGSRHGNAKLTEQAVATIRQEERLPNEDKESFCRRIAMKYGVSRTCIYEIIHRRRWQHIA